MGTESGRSEASGNRSLGLNIFICYRREDSAGFARALKTVLGDRYGKDHIFMDLDNIAPGKRWKEVVDKAVSSCDVLIALIGKRWLTVRDKHGQHRLANPLDPVRLEIQTALRQNLGFIPALLEDAKMPSTEQLPDELVALQDIQALDITDDWDAGVAKLIAALDSIAEGKYGAKTGPSMTRTAPAPAIAPSPPPSRQPRRSLRVLIVATVVLVLAAGGAALAILARHYAPPDTALHDYLWKAYRLVQQSAGQLGKVNAAVEAKDAETLRSLQDSRSELLATIQAWQVPPAARPATSALEQALHYSAISDGNWAGYVEGRFSLDEARTFDRDKVHPAKYAFDSLYNQLVSGIEDAPPKLPPNFLF